MAATSEPALGSETPRQETRSPVIDGFKNSLHISSLPKRANAGVDISVCTPIAIGTPPHLICANASLRTAPYE